MNDPTRNVRREPARNRWSRRIGRCIAVAALSQQGWLHAQTAGSGLTPPVPVTPPTAPSPAVPVPVPGRAGQGVAPSAASPSDALMGVPLPPLPDSVFAVPKVITPATGDEPPPANPAEMVPPPPRPEIPRVIPIEAGAGSGGMAAPATPKFVQFQRDTTGLVSNRPPGTFVGRPPAEVKEQVERMLELVQGPEAEIAVVIGHSKIIQTRRPLSRIVVSDPKVADVNVLNDVPTNANQALQGRLLNLQGLSFGTSTITLWEVPDAKGVADKPMTFLIRVSLDTLDLESRIKQAFPGSVIHIRQLGTQLILEGQVPDAKTMSEILDLISIELRNSGRIQPGAGASQATAGAAAQGAAQGATQGAVAQGANPGAAASSAASGAAQGAAQGAGFLTVINRVRIPGPRQILLHVKLAELNRTAIRRLGVNWLDTRNNAILGSNIGDAGNIAGNVTHRQAQSLLPFARGGGIDSTFGSGASASNNSSQLFGIFNAGQFSIFLNALRANSLAKILAEPNLVALDGHPAQFQAGGSFPYPVAQGSSVPGGGATISITFAQYGAILKFLPHILENDVIRLDVSPSFSQLDYAAGTSLPGAGPVPGITQRSVRTEVELREGQTLAIAGLLQTVTGSSTDRVPFLGDLPIVGSMFSNNKDQIVETELIVLVTPELIAPMEAHEVPPSPGDRVTQANDYEFFFLGRIEGKLGREHRATVAEHDPLSVMKHFNSENRWVVGPHGHSD